MPHDKNGVSLKVGDEVLIRGRIVNIQETPHACNCTVELAERMPFAEGPSAHPTQIGAINTKQLELAK